jgi:hypothetical protein
MERREVSLKGVAGFKRTQHKMGRVRMGAIKEGSGSRRSGGLQEEAAFAVIKGNEDNGGTGAPLAGFVPPGRLIAQHSSFIAFSLGSTRFTQKFWSG